MPQSTPPNGQNIEFLFLASHGLLSPISAIRWGCNRLKKMSANLSPEQKEVVDHVHANAKTLSTMFGGMLTLARNEDKTYSFNKESVNVRQLLQHQAEECREGREGTFTIHCPEDLTVVADRGMLENIFQQLFFVYQDAAATEEVTVTANANGTELVVSLVGAMELSFLDSVQTVERTQEVRTVVGGTAGLLLSIAQSLLWFIDGTLTMKKAEGGGYGITATVPVGK